jgi:single-strand selective monofunctional uracil DNA glycosylase
LQDWIEKFSMLFPWQVGPMDRSREMPSQTGMSLLADSISHRMSLVEITRKAIAPLQALRFPKPVACVYLPLDYAFSVHRAFLERYGRGKKEALFVGMNPGPFGMVQTGVPFGEVAAVKGWLGLTGKVRKPAMEHPKRPIEGLECARSEVSGRRFWGWAERRFVTPERFFARFYVHNYCPLAFLSETGSNITPDKLPKSAVVELFSHCDRLLQQVVATLQPELVIGVGAFAELAAKRALGAAAVRYGRVAHPSPASPAANRGWEPLIERGLADLGVTLP